MNTLLDLIFTAALLYFGFRMVGEMNAIHQAKKIREIRETAEKVKTSMAMTKKKPTKKKPTKKKATTNK